MYSFVTAFKYYSMARKLSDKTQEKFLETFQKVLEERIPQDIEVTINNLRMQSDFRIRITIDGKRADDESFVASILKELVGESLMMDELKPKQIVRGTCQSVGKIGFGLFVDAGIENPTKEILIPLYNLRAQLVKNEKLPAREILEKYGFMEHLPVQVEITRVDLLRPDQPQIEGRFTNTFINQLQSWIDEGNDVVFAVGESRKTIKRIVAKRGHTPDILKFQRLGPLETALICKQDTYAPGIITEIGPYLLNSRLSMLIPGQVRRFWH